MQYRNLRETNEYKTLSKAMEGSSSTVALFGVPQAGRAHIAAMLCEDVNKPVIVITGSEASSVRFAEDALCFGAKSTALPAREFMLQAIEGQSRAIEYSRLNILGDIVGGRCNMVVASVEAALQLTVPKEQFLKSTLTIKKGMEIKQQDLIFALHEAGYYRRPLVEGPGQFSVRGGIVDIFPPDTVQPARLEFWGDIIDDMAVFDLFTQRRESKLVKMHISPAREVLISTPKQAIELIENYSEQLNGKDKEAFLEAVKVDLKQLEADIMPEGMDKYLPLLYTTPGTIFDYFDDFVLFIDEPSVVKENYAGFEKRFVLEMESLFERGILVKGMDTFYKDYTYLLQQVKKAGTIVSENFVRTIADFRLDELVNATAHALPVWNGTVSALLEDIAPLLQQKYDICIYAATKKAATALHQDLLREGYSAEIIEKGTEINTNISIAVGGLSGGVEYPFARLAIITGRGKGIAEVTERRRKKKSKGLTSLDDIKPGDYVVHQNYGIGVYNGIHRIDLHGVVKDYIKVQYAKADTLYLPVTQMDLLSRYTAPQDSDKVKLATLGGADWEKTKTRVRKATEEMAKELIDLYAKRKMVTGHAFPEDDEWQRDFETRFEFEETEDQLVSAYEIKNSMEETYPMDRLLCGDVGVGKTEVALRAAFKAIMGGKQVALLVPTTILAWQHYNTILRRMEAFPVKVELLSRFRTPKQQKQTLQNLRAGVCDLVVGTHRLLQKDIHFKDLGLLIIDEEQRFGVKHKEKLKESFPIVDVLTLSATPIPRTLSMAMNGIRDMSTIEEPPIDRQPVETYVVEYDDQLIAQALQKEIARGGQVYYLHNRIETIDRTAAKIAQLVPGARIGIAHGRMKEEELSDVWQDLLDGEIDILVCTTLIETGVDVRNCNTLIVENADTMGLAQLYQIRGRVGRGARRAYAYFTFKRDKVLTEIAAKRLGAIREFTSFGSGFRIAMRDLQIRGAGNLLGQSQHGHMEAVGYDLYVKLLNRAIAELRGEELPADKSNCLIDITVDAYIPESYIPDAASRIEAYKRIAAIETEEDALDVTDELKDRFGELPKSARGLMHISLVRVTAAELNIYEIVQKREELQFYSDAFHLGAIQIICTDDGENRAVRFHASAKPYISTFVRTGEEPIEVITEVLSRLATHSGQGG